MVGVAADGGLVGEGGPALLPLERDLTLCVQGKTGREGYDVKSAA